MPHPCLPTKCSLEERPWPRICMQLIIFLAAQVVLFTQLSCATSSFSSPQLVLWSFIAGAASLMCVARSTQGTSSFSERMPPVAEYVWLAATTNHFFFFFFARPHYHLSSNQKESWNSTDIKCHAVMAQSWQVLKGNMPAALCSLKWILIGSVSGSIARYTQASESPQPVSMVSILPSHWHTTAPATLIMLNWR